MKPNFKSDGANYFCIFDGWFVSINPKTKELCAHSDVDGLGFTPESLDDTILVLQYLRTQITDDKQSN